MMHGHEQFIEGFLAAAQALGMEQSDAGWQSLAYGVDEHQCHLPADQEDLFRKTRLPMDAYLAIPTFMRQGKIVSEPRTT